MSAVPFTTAPGAEARQVPKTAPLLSVNDIVVRFGGVVALDGVSFDVQPGQICGLIGPNGAGKTTLFNCLSRLYAWASGSIEFDGRSIESMQRHGMAGAGIGRTFQNLALFPSMDVLSNVLVGCYGWQQPGFLGASMRLPAARRREREALENARALVEFFGLASVAHRPVGELPFGTRKRVEFARALAARPKLLLLDEPACGLNHEEVEGLTQLISRVREQFRLTVLLVEHNMGLVMGLCEHVVVLNFGKTITQGTPAAVQRHPDVVAAYLGEEKA